MADGRRILLVEKPPGRISTITLAMLLFCRGPRTIAAMVCNNDGVRDLSGHLETLSRVVPANFFAF